MNDITALVQRMKTAAEKAKHAGEAPIMPFDTRISALNEFQLAACPDKVLALVEALEKAQAERDEFRNRLKLERGILADADKRIAELEKAAEPVGEDELDQLIWGLERYGLYPRQLAALVELREVRKARPVVPGTLPCPVFLESGLKFGKGVRTQCMLDALNRRAEYHAELDAMTPEQRAEHDAGIAEFKAMLGGNPPVTPDCWCLTCRPVTMNDTRFVVCPDCGNKRCPRANDHQNACTGSNEPGQDGSAYPAASKEVR